MPEELGNCDNCECDYYDVDGYDMCWHSGVARCLTPITELCCGVGEAEWNYLTWGLDGDELFYMVPHALKICGCLTSDSNSKLFVVDGYDVDESYDAYDMVDGEYGAVWTFEDCYAKKAVELTSPVDGFVVPTSACECENAPFLVKWDRLCDACCYEIMTATDEDFTDYYSWIVEPSAPLTPSEWMEEGWFLPETTYYWKVRTVQAETCQDIYSWWSEPQSFTISPTASSATIHLVSPEPGTTGMARIGLGFSWNLLASADEFDWVLSENADLSAPIESKTGLTSTAYGCTKNLDYDTTHYWQVTAYKDGTAIAISSVGTFRTLTQASEPVEPEPEPTPFWVWVVIAIGAVLVIVVIVLIFRTRRV